MELIKLPRMRHNELQSLAESTLRMCNGQDLLAESLRNVTNYLERFKAARQKGKTSLSKADLDKNRDRLITGMMYDFRAEAYYPHAEEMVRLAAEQLNALLKKYGAKINRLPNKEETAAIDNLIVELEKMNPEALETLNIARWIVPIKDANAAFKQADDAAIEMEVTNDLPAASEIESDLYDSLDQLYSLIYAHARIGQDEQLVHTYKRIEELIDSIK